MYQQNNIGYKQIKIKKNYFIKSRNSMKFSRPFYFPASYQKLTNTKIYLIYSMLYKYLYSSVMPMYM